MMGDLLLGLRQSMTSFESLVFVQRLFAVVQFKNFVSLRLKQKTTCYLYTNTSSEHQRKVDMGSVVFGLLLKLGSDLPSLLSSTFRV